MNTTTPTPNGAPSRFVRDPVLGISQEEHRAYPRMYRTMMAIGLLATVHRLTDDADIVYAAVEPSLQDPSVLHIRRAMVEARAGDASAAVELMEKRFEADSDFYSKVLQGGAMSLAGDPGWKAPLEYVIALCTDPDLRETALNLLALHES